jgi:hypothetical protein
MSNGFSPQNEQYLSDIVAGGYFPSRQAALDAAIDALREKRDGIAYISDEEMALVQEGLDDLEQNGAVEMTEADWESLRQHARDVAAGRRSATE